MALTPEQEERLLEFIGRLKQWMEETKEYRICLDKKIKEMPNAVRDSLPCIQHSKRMGWNRRIIIALCVLVFILILANVAEINPDAPFIKWFNWIRGIKEVASG